MRVVCENCGATYKIPESKLVQGGQQSDLPQVWVPNDDPPAAAVVAAAAAAPGR